MGSLKTVFILLFLFDMSYALACSCSNLSIGERVVSSDIVVVGEVLESQKVCLETIGEHCYGPIVFYVQNTELLKSEGWQATESKQLRKSTFISDFGNCTFFPKKGEKWLLFGKLVTGTLDTYTTSVCSGNRKMDDSGEIPQIRQIKTFIQLYQDNKVLNKHSEKEFNN